MIMMMSCVEIRVASILLLCAYLNTQGALAQPLPVEQDVGIKLSTQRINPRPLEHGGRRKVMCDTNESQYPQWFTFYKVDKNGNTTIICIIDHQIDNCITRNKPLLYGSTYMCGCLNNTRFIYLNITDGTDKIICKRQSDDKQLPVYYGPDDVQLVAHRSMDFGIRYYTGSSKLEAIEGETVLVTCRANCNPACSVNLYLGAIEDERLLSTDGNYPFINVTRDLDGTRIFCKVKRRDESAYSVTKEMNVTIAYGPKFIKLNTEKITTVIEGKDLSVTCTSDCNPPCNFKWFDITRGPRYNTRLTSGGTLTMLNISTNMTGKYVCRARNAVYHNSNMMLLIVNHAPIVSITSDAINNIVSENSSVTLTCSVDSSLSSNISWSRSQQGYLSSEASLFIPVATCAHTDNYTCTVKNGIGSSVSRTISLNIKCLPRMDKEKNKDTKVDKITARIGQTAELSIHLLVGPPARFTWYRQYSNRIKEQVTDFWTKQNDTAFSSILRIEEVTALDFGYYKVYVRNCFGVRSRLFELNPARHSSVLEN
ncbi:carcinoembryonic antigen-related cell adhesion molecule 1 isoform X2 [Patella vulgata]|uniref:carcinoembryonic antigen-related cell adhesion molecule 1 isoform X2 n=1 Tax=Patella vulgata TaxID=6465 RepID=UPI0024A9CD0A|nr:carcinoembryonic antigen-related cell adhesion molecule 1 isoform X2 [Patella vulgata]